MEQPPTTPPGNEPGTGSTTGNAEKPPGALRRGLRATGRGIRMVWRGFRTLLRWIGTLLYWCFGRYTLPPGLRFLLKLPFRLLGLGWRWLMRWRRAHAPSFWVAAPVLAALLVVGLWWLMRPLPPGITFHSTTPGPRDLVNNQPPPPLFFTFSDSAAPLDQIGRDIKEGVSISPEIPGKWSWNSDRMLIFRPEADWAIGAEYKVTFAESLFPSHVRLRTYSHEVRTARFTGDISGKEFYQDPRDPKLKKVVVRLRFSHPVDTQDFPSRVQMHYMQRKGENFDGLGAPVPFEVRFNDLHTEAYIHSEPLKIPPVNSMVRVFVDEDAVAAAGGPGMGRDLEAKVRVPGLATFFQIGEIHAAMVENAAQEKEFVLIVNTTAGIAPKELANSLDVYELPRDRPALQGLPGRQSHHWRDPSEVGREVLALSRKITPEALPHTLAFPKTHSFRLDVKDLRFLYVVVRQGAMASGGFALVKSEHRILQTPPYPREVRIVHEGTLLPLGGMRHISIAARNLPGLHYEMYRVKKSDLAHFVSQTHGEMNWPEFDADAFNQHNVGEGFRATQELKPLPGHKIQYTSFDFSEYLSGRDALGVFLLRVRGYDPKTKKLMPASDQRLVVVTDLGVLVKESANGGRDVFVQSLAAGQPLAGVQVQVLGRNGLPVREGRTSGEGHVRLDSMTALARENTPTVYMVSRGSDVSFLPYEGFNRSLELSRFDIGGVNTPSSGKGLDAFLFSDRGLYRPGDTAHLGMIIKPGDWTRGIEGIPLLAVIRDPRGAEVLTRNFRAPASGLTELDFATHAASPTGDYTVNLFLEREREDPTLLGSTDFRVEEFIPDNLRIRVRIADKPTQGWLHPRDLTGIVQLRTLFGIAAADRKVTGAMRLEPGLPALPGHEGYRFHDPARAKEGTSEMLAETRTDAKGEARLPMPMERYSQATYRLLFTAEGHEAEGGRAVSGRDSVVISPRPYLVGYKPDGKLDFIREGSERTVHLVAVSPQLKQIAVKGISAELLVIKHVSVLAKQTDGTYKYESVRKEETLYKKALPIGAKGATLKLPTDKSGDFVFVLREGGSDGGNAGEQKKGEEPLELSRIPFTVAGAGQLARGLDKNAELQLRLDKQDYAPGETIQMEIRAPYNGSGLISIEREKVIAFKWFRATSSTTMQRIRVPEGLEGNAYVNVSFVRAPDSPEIFTSPLSYGVAPFTLSRDARRNRVTLDAPEKVRPGDVLEIGYKTSRKGHIVVFAVDEGILQVAEYKTPDPLGHFFRKRALQVETRQMLDLLLPEYRVVRALSAPGGGGFLAKNLASEMARANLNPFRRKALAAAAYWSGVVESGPERRTVKYTVPDHFNGTLRLMAVAVAADALDGVEDYAISRGPFVISPNAPTFIAPGDQFQLSAAVANNLEGTENSTTVKVALQLPPGLEAVDGLEREVRIAPMEEAVVRYQVKAGPSPGAKRLTFRASGGNERVGREVTLSVRPASPYRVVVQGGAQDGGDATLERKRTLFKEFGEVEATASTLPLGLSQGLLRYLDGFGYLCTEQLISKALPALVLRDRQDFGLAPALVNTRLDQALRVMQARQTNMGAFAVWAAHAEVSPLQSAYAGHFLLEARQRGYHVPDDMLNRAMQYLNGMAKGPPETLHEARAKAYAIYVLTRLGRNMAPVLDTLRGHLERMRYPDWEKDMTGVLMAGAYRLLQQEDRARALISKVNIGDRVKANYAYYYDQLLRDAVLLYMIAMHFPEEIGQIDAEALQRFSEPIMHGGFNTFSASFTILALDAYAKGVGDPKKAGLAMQGLDAANKATDIALPAGIFPKTSLSLDTAKVRYSVKEDVPLFYQLSESGFDLELPKEVLKEGLEVYREIRNTDGAAVTEAHVGEKLTVILRLRSVDDEFLRHVAVVDLLPGGFEVDLPSIRRPTAQRNQFEGRRFVQRFPEYVDAREDRVLLFGTAAGGVREYSYRIRAISPGTFVLPPIYAESMYNRAVQGLSLGGTFIVTAEE